MTCLMVPLADCNAHVLSASARVADIDASTGVTTRLEAPRTKVLSSTPSRPGTEWGPKDRLLSQAAAGRRAANARDHTGATTITLCEAAVNASKRGSHGRFATRPRTD